MTKHERIVRSVTIASASLVSCLFVYPLVHECGHLIPALVSGAEVTEFVWTPLLGSPHVGLNRVSGEALPWVDAGGMLLPTFVGTCLIAIWLSLPLRQPPPPWRCWILIPGGFLLLGNLGIFFEAAMATNRLDHMDGLARRVAGDGVLGVVLELAPALWTCLLIGLVARRWRGQRRSDVPSPTVQS